MNDIELVIKISENDLQSIGKKVFTVGEMFETVQGRVYCAIVKGTQLPKGHGRLIDKNELLTVTDYMEDGTERCYVPYVHIKEAETIIEADRSEEKMKREEAFKKIKAEIRMYDEESYESVEWEECYEALKQTNVLDKIRDEIKQEYKLESEHPYGQGLRRALEIIDKYKESEE